MGAMSHVATIPAQLVRAPSGFGLYQRITVGNAAASLISLLSGGVLPVIPVPNISGPAGLLYSIKYVDLQAETDPLTTIVRYTDDGQTVPTSTLGFVVPGGNSPFLRIPCDPQDIQLISAGGNVMVQVRLGIMGVTTGGN
jgi:hypothetical protein